MGTGSVSGVTFYTPDGIPLPSAIDLPEIAAPEEAAGTESYVWPDTELTLTFKMKTPKHWRCRSRKRFIKLLMGEGMSRNEAVMSAEVVRRIGVPYRTAWHTVVWG